MPVLIPAEEYFIIRPSDIDEVTTTLDGMDFDRIYESYVEDLERQRSKGVKIQLMTRTVPIYRTIAMSLSSAASVALMIQVLINIRTLYDTATEEKRKKKQRGALCVYACFDILEGVINQGDIKSYLEQYAMETSDTAKRSKRTFMSRKKNTKTGGYE